MGHTLKNPHTEADFLFVMACRDALPEGMAREMDERIARHALKIRAERGLSEEAAAIEAVEQVAALLRSKFAAVPMSLETR